MSTRPAEPRIEIVNRRVFAAPRERVFAAFAQPAQLVHWWGPHGFTNRIPIFEFRPGGAWRIVMRAADGSEFDNASRFLEIAPPERIVYEHLQPMHGFRMEMTYGDAAGGGTELTWRMLLEPTSEHERLREFLAAANEQNFDRLAAFLAAG